MNDSFQREERISIARILNQVVDQQHQNIVQFNNVSAALESIRTEIRRTDENHSKELERLHGIIRALLPQHSTLPTPQQVYNGSATAANFFAGPVQPPNIAYEQHRQLLQQQMALMSLQAYQRSAPAAPTMENNLAPPPARTEAPPSTPVHHTAATSKQETPISDSRDEISSDSSEGEPWDVDRTLDSEKKTDVSIEEKHAAAKPFSDFLKKNDQWECRDCYTCNAADAGKCVCCGTNKDGSKDEENIFAKPAPSESSSKFSFGLSAVKPSLKTEGSDVATPSKPRVSFADAAKVIAVEEKPPVTPQKAVGEAPKLAFGAAASASGNIFGGTTKVDTKPTFSFSKPADDGLRPHAGLLPSKPLFGMSLANKSQDDTKSTSKPTKIFGSASTTAFSFPKPTGESIFNEEAKKEALEEFSKLKTSTFGGSEPSNAAEVKDDESVEDYEPTLEFTPVCPLPDLVEVVTGEENEKVVFEDRCKLYRYINDTKEWKERGTGTIKILLDESSGKARCVMRREQTHKLACNFRLMKGMTISKMGKNDKAAVWLCMDFSEENNAPEKFSAKFGSTEKNSEFIKHFQHFCN